MHTGYVLSRVLSVDNASDIAKPLVNDQLWKLIEPILPKYSPRPRRGRLSDDDRRALTGIIFVLKTGIPWQYLPKEMGCGSGMPCWRRPKECQKAGIWDKMHRIMLNNLREKDKIDFSRAVVDSASVRAVFEGRKRTRMRRIDGN